MLNTFTSKFTFFFWSVFLIITIPIYIFGTFYIKDVLQTTEHEKIQLMVNTLKPTIALNLSFEQDEELQTVFNTILKETNIIKIEFDSNILQKTFVKKKNGKVSLLLYETSVVDPFDTNSVAKIKIYYSNDYLITLYNKVNTALLIISLFSLVVFFTFYIFMKKELNALTHIANIFQNYSKSKPITAIETKSKTLEIITITKTANEMIQNISTYFSELQHLNSKLENIVKEKVEELHMQERMLVHQSRQAAMGEMIESIAHQWRQPLNIIGIASANLEMEHDLGIKNDKNFKEKMQIIFTNINYMSNTIDDFRDFLNPDRELLYFNPKDSIEDVYKILSAQLSNNNINLELNSNEEVQLYGIENEFKQVVFILLNNAQDAIKSLQKESKIEKGIINIKLAKRNENISISFCDNGGGIPDDVINSIFNPYFTTKFASSGTGIGLYMAKNIIESRMHGSLETYNTETGCCFEIQQHTNIKDQI